MGVLNENCGAVNEFLLGEGVGAVTFWVVVEDGVGSEVRLVPGSSSVFLMLLDAGAAARFAGFPVNGHAGGESDQTFFDADHVTHFSITACAAARMVSSS